MTGVETRYRISDGGGLTWITTDADRAAEFSRVGLRVTASTGRR